MDTGDRERAAREFVDAVSGPGTWDKRPPQVRAMVLDDLATAPGDPAKQPHLSCDDIRAIGTPMLLVRGERSPKRYVDMVAALHACKTALAAPVVIPNASHSMNRDNPAAFNAAVMEFLARH